MHKGTIMKTTLEIERKVTISLSSLINDVTKDSLERMPSILESKRIEIEDQLINFLIDCQQVSINGEEIEYVS